MRTLISWLLCVSILAQGAFSVAGQPTANQPQAVVKNAWWGEVCKQQTAVAPFIPMPLPQMQGIIPTTDVSQLVGQALNAPPRKSIDSEMKDVVKFVTDEKQVHPLEAPDLRFFTFYAMPAEQDHFVALNGKEFNLSLRQSAMLVLSFVLNSCAHFQNSQGLIVTPKMVPGSDTLCYINIRDYGWDAKQWDQVAQADPYVVEPLVNHSDYNLGRLVGGNLLFRGDWFIVNATDPQRQVEARIPQLLYYILLFGQPPADAKEFLTNLGVDPQGAIKRNLDRRTVLEAGNSGVSIETGGNRKIQAIRTDTGYYYETFDTRINDYLNNPDDDNREAGEYIVSHKNGTQIYFLVNDKNARVDVADNGVVDDTRRSTLVVKRGAAQGSRPVDRRIHTAMSCIWCHEAGINQAGNDFVTSLNEGVKFNFLVNQNFDPKTNYDKYREVRDKFLQKERQYIHNNLNETIAEDNNIYLRAIQACNGLEPAQNAALYLEIVNWYNRPLGLTQAAVECGLSNAQYIERTTGSISARINRIVASDSFTIPRRYWDNFNPAGDYATSILTIRLHDAEKVKATLLKYHNQASATPVPTPAETPQAVEENKVVEEEKKESLPPKKELLVQVDCQVIVSENGIQTPLGDLQKGATIPYIKKQGEWYQVEYQGKIGYVLASNCTEVK